MNSPTPDEIRALLESCDISAYAAAKLASVSANNMQKAVAGKNKLGPAAWQLLRVSVSKKARAELPKPIVK
jgi:hypothetical protein